MISPEAVMGMRRPEFGPSPAKLEARLRAQLGIRREDGQLTYRPTAEQRKFLKEQLAARGLPTSQLDDLKYVSGLDKEAGFFTRFAFDEDDIEAVTQGSTVSVKPEKFAEYASFASPAPFEEAYHTGQFASDEAAGFYSPYGTHFVGGLLSSMDGYNANLYEAFAKGASKEMLKSYRYKKGGKRR